MSHTDIQREASKIWRLATAPLRRLPDFLIPGAPKCGTSSLFDLIMFHPEARRGLRKEPTNFIHYPTSVLRSRMNQPPQQMPPPLCRMPNSFSFCAIP
ncbi:MAG: hypothetical protein EBY32_02275 [Proteobacteria bacterium]|nr:hypothetical protein [Pseudomonadota bacterium]